MRNTRALFIGILVALILCWPPAGISAAKPRIRTPAGKPAAVGAAATGYAKARLSRATHSVVATFMNLTGVSKVTYELSYTASGIPQGVIGAVTPSGVPTETRDLYFGTCSKGVCTPHTGITDAVLRITTILKSGKRYIKIYRIRI